MDTVVDDSIPWKIQRYRKLFYHRSGKYSRLGANTGVFCELGIRSEGSYGYYESLRFRYNVPMHRRSGQKFRRTFLYFSERLPSIVTLRKVWCAVRSFLKLIRIALIIRNKYETNFSIRNILFCLICYRKYVIECNRFRVYLSAAPLRTFRF